MIPESDILKVLLNWEENGKCSKLCVPVLGRNMGQVVTFIESLGIYDVWPIDGDTDVFMNGLFITRKEMTI